MSERSKFDGPSRAVILAAGRGKRLRPLTNYCPKPLLPVHGRPVLDYILEALANCCVRQVCLIVGHLGEQIEAYLGTGERWGVVATYRQQEPLLGTAHALRQAADFLSGPTFVLAADYALPPDYLVRLNTAYQKAGTDMAVSLKWLPREALADSSSVRYDANERICEILEKPAPGEAHTQLAASLIYIVPPDITRYLDDLRLSARQEYELADVVNQMLADGFSLTGCQQAAPLEPEATGSG